jgi:hypothetical protein
MAFNDITVEAGAIIDAQYAVHAAYDAANDTANDRSYGTSVVFADSSAMSSALWYALSVYSSRHGKRHRADEQGVSNHCVSLVLGVKLRNNALERRRFPDHSPIFHISQKIYRRIVTRVDRHGGGRWPRSSRKPGLFDADIFAAAVARSSSIISKLQ